MAQEGFKRKPPINLGVNVEDYGFPQIEGEDSAIFALPKYRVIEGILNYGLARLQEFN